MHTALKQGIRRIPVIGPMLKAVYGRIRARLAPAPVVRFESSTQYWDDRYKVGATSGAGSYNRLARFKADVLNEFVAKHHIKSVVEWGSGDGAQLALAIYPRYIGYDVSAKVIEMCRARFRADTSKEFHLVGDAQPAFSDLSLSLDVIYHLVEDDVFHLYMRQLFDAAKRFVIIYSSNKDEPSRAAHVRHRRFTDWVEQNRSEWKLQQVIPNKYAFDEANQDETSFADFYIFAKCETRGSRSDGGPIA